MKKKYDDNCMKKKEYSVQELLELGEKNNRLLLVENEKESEPPQKKNKD